ncbi:MAG: T9SS type A sorting domain-containing protein [Bacteroidetes bacterium]|nr:T9SS type A sorting domain-containing protein [Bacteroidota bacterium]
MKKLLFLLIAMVFSIVGWGQTIFTQNFEGTWTNASSLSPAWSGTTTPADDVWQKSSYTTGWTSSSGAFSPLGANSTTAAARFHTYDAASATTGDLISPTINLSAYTAGTVKLSFYHINTSGTDALNVYVSNDNGATWSSALAPSPIGTSASWTLKSITLPGNSATTKIKFTATSDYGTTDIGIDEIRVYIPAPADAAPNAFTSTSVTQTGMTIGWNDNSTNEIAFRVYRSSDNINFTQQGSDITSTSTATTGTLYTQNQTGLLAGITYYYRIVAVYEAESPYLTGSQATNPPGNIVSTATGGKWSATTTWVGGVVPTATDNVTIVSGAIDTIDLATPVCYNLTVAAGSILRFGTTAATLNVNGSVTVEAGGIFDAGATGGASLTHTLYIGGNVAAAGSIGNLLNNGIFNMWIGATNGKATVAFYGSSNTSVSGTGTTNFSSITLNKGAVTATTLVTPPILDIQVPFTVQGANTVGLIGTHTAGVLKISGSYTQSNPLFTTAAYTIPALGGLWLNNANFTALGTAGSPTVTGLLRISSGTYNVGTGTGNSLGNGAGAVVLIEGGIVNVAGRLNLTSACTYTQSAGNVTVNISGNASSSNASFGITSTSSVFNMSGGNIIIQGVSTGGTQYDYYNLASVINITGGTLKIGNSSSGTAKTFKIAGATPNLIVDNASANHGLTLFGHTTVYGDFTMNGTGVFSLSTQYNLNMKGMNASYPGNIVNNGTFTLNAGSTQSLTFSSSVGNQTFTNNGTITNSQLPTTLTINNTFAGGSVTLPNGLGFKDASISPNLNLTAGSLVATSLTFGAGGTAGFNVIRTEGSLPNAPIFAFGSGAVNYTYNGTSAQTTGLGLPPSISGTLLINNPGGITLASNLIVTGALTLTSGVLSGSNTLTLGNGGTTLPFTMTRTSGSVTCPVSCNLASGPTNAWVYNAPTPAAAYSTGNELPPSALISSLTINNPSGITLNAADAVVKTALILTSGVLSGSNPLTLGLQLGFTMTRSSGSVTCPVSFNLGTGQTNTWVYNAPTPAAAYSTGSELPSTGISALTINNTSGITLDKTLAVSTTLTMTSGNFTIGTNNLTLGTSVAVPGTLSYSSGLIVTTGGTFTRWFPITGLPTSVGTGIGYYPMAVSVGGVATNREVKLAFSSATALTAGGTITCAVAHAAGLTTGLSIADTVPNYIINRRTNSSWTLTPGAGIADTGTIIMRAQATGVIATNNYTYLHLVQSASIAGRHSAGTNTNTDPWVNRTLLKLANLSSGSFYVGAADSNMSNVIYSAQTGNWNLPSSWVGGLVPGPTDVVVILNTHTITVTDAQSAYTVAVNSGGVLTASAGTLTVIGASTTGVYNYAGGLININGGTLTLGPAGGGNRTFSNYGSLTVASGTLNINGNFYNSSSTNNIFTQSGGNINVDGNAAGVAANSVAAATYLVQLSSGSPTTVFFTGGTFTVVDPHVSAQYALYMGVSPATNCTTGHTFAFGDGVSTDPGSANGFYTYFWPSSYFILGNVVVNGPLGINRFVNFTSYVGILGNLTINNGGELRTSSTANYIAGNITVNSGGVLTNPNTITLGNFASGTATASTNAQTISGAGNFRNLLPTAAISVGGTGYVVGDVLTLLGGTYTSQAQFVVTAVTSGAVTSVMARGYSNYSVLPTTPASTSGGTGSGCTLTTLTNLAPTASLASLTVNNTNASGVTMGTPLSVSGTLTLTAGIVNTTTANILTLGTATAAGTLSGGGATAYISGPFARTFAARTATGTYTTTTLYPVGKGALYLPIWMDPTVVTNPVVMSGEAFATNSGSGGPGVTYLSPERWEAKVTSGIANFTGSYIQLGDVDIASGNQIIQAPSAAGAYGAIVPASLFTTGTIKTLTTTGSQILAAAYTGYFSYGNLTPCTAPANQPTNFSTQYTTSTGVNASFTAAVSAPSNYLIVRYPVDSINIIAPVNYTTYTVGSTNAALGTIVSISNATSFIQTGLTAGKTYTYYVYSYNNSGCYGPVYNATSPLSYNVTTCAAAVTVPGTLTASVITNVGFNVSWTTSGAGVSYILDVATDNAFTSFVSGYPKTIGADVLTDALTGLLPSTYYYVRVRAYDNTSCYSVYSSTLTVLTKCDPVTTYPFLESVSPATISCWSVASGTGSSYNWSYTTADAAHGAAAPQAGTYFFNLNCYNASTTYNPYYLYSPVFRLDGAPKQLKYYYWIGNDSYLPVPLALQISRDFGNTWLPADTLFNHRAGNSTFATSSTSPWTLNTIDLTAFAGQGLYVQFRFISYSNYGYNLTNHGIDEFRIENITSPTVTTTKATAITGSTATSGGVVTDNGGAVVTARGVCWSTNAAPSLLDAYTTDGGGNGAFVSSLTSLAPDQWYHLRAYATNAMGTSYGGDSIFKTLNVFAPGVTMDFLANITNISATANGTVDNDGGSGPILMNGFVISTTVANPLITTPGVVVDTVVTPGVGGYSVGITGLTAGTLYYINAFAKNSVGTSYGTATSFTTIGLTTTAASAITPFTAISGGNIISDGGNLITARGVCYGTASTPDISGTHTTDGTGMGSFVSNLTLPTAATLYHIRAYATNSLGTFYGNDLTFTTLCDPGILSLSSTSVTRCGTGTATLSATTTGTGISWYDSAIDGSKLGSGVSFTTPIINATTIYYAESNTTSVGGTAPFGTASTLTSSTSYPTLYGNYWYQDWSQMVYTASELANAGLAAGNITALTFKLGAVADASPSGYTIKMGTTASSSLSGFTTTGLTNVYGPVTPTMTTGFNVFTLSTPYYWDGVSNIIIDIRGNGGYGDANATTYYTATTDNTVVYAYSYSDNSGFFTSSPAATTSKSRLNVIFSGTALCRGTRVADTVFVTPPSALTLTGTDTVCNTQINVNIQNEPLIVAKHVTSTIGDYAFYVWSPVDSLYLDATATTPYTGASATTVYFKSTKAGNYTYTCNASNVGAYSCANVATTKVTVRSAPGITVTTSLNPICDGNSTTISAITNAAVYTTPSVLYPTSYEDLGNITFGSLNNTTTVNSLVGTIGDAVGTAGSYSDFTAFGPYNYTAGNTYQMTLSSITASAYNYSNAFGVYIDYNHNGVFTDPGEAVYLSAATVSGNHTDTTNITIPLTAYNGNTRMRVISKEGLVTSSSQIFSYGEYEEYTINITGGADLYSYAWSDGQFSLGTSSSITVAPSGTTIYFMTLTESDGCSKMFPTPITVSQGAVITSQPIASSVCAGNDATFTVNATGVGLTYQWRKNGVSIADNASALTASLVLPAVTNADVDNYDVVINAICGTPATSTVAHLTVKPRPGSVPSSNSPVCSGFTLNLTGGTTYGTSFSWTGPNSFTSTSQDPIINSVLSSASGTYRLIATLNGCSDTATTTVVVNETPSSVTISPSSASIPYGSVQSLTANGGAVSGVQIFSENFDGASSSFVLGSKSGTNNITAVQNTTYYSEGISSYLLSTSTISDTAWYEMSNAINMTSYTSSILSFNHICAMEAGFDYCAVQYSTDNGATWITFPTSSYAGAGTLKLGAVCFDKSSYSDWGTQFTSSASTPGTPPATSLWKTETINIPNDALTPDFKIRFRIRTDGSVFYYGWLIDNVKITGTGTATMAWAPTSGLYTDAAATIPYTGSYATTVYANPSSNTTYTATATSLIGGCTNSGSVNVVLTCPAPVLVPASNVIGATTAKLYWTSPSTNFGIEVQPLSTAFTGVPNHIVTGNSTDPHYFNISGLSGATAYHYQIIGDCGSIAGNWSLPGTFTTDALPVPGLWTGLSVTSNNWSDVTNWSDHLEPIAGVNVVIPATAPRSPHVNTTAECNDLTIALGSSLTLTIDAGKYLTVNGTLTNNADESHFVIKSTGSGTGSLIHHNSGVLATVERNIHNEVADEFYMLGSPVAAQVIENHFNETDGFYGWNEVTGEWVGFGTPDFMALNPTGTFTPGLGYAVSYPTLTYPGDTVKTFTGSLNDGSHTIALSKTVGSLYEGWNFVSNPYPSAIDWDNNYDNSDPNGLMRTALEDVGYGNYSMWMWNADAGSYGNYISNGGGATNGLTSMIPSAHGFWIQLFNEAGEFTMNDGARLHNAQPFWKSSTSTSEQIRLKVTGTANTYRDEMLVRFGNASDLKGGEKMFSMYATAPSLYSTKLNKNWGINYLTTIAQHSVVPVSFKAGANGNYTIHASELNSFATTTYVYLKDLFTNTITDLNQTADYTFAASTTDNANRFQLLFALSPLSISDNVIENTSIYSNNSSIYVNSNETIKQIAIYNTLGQLIKTVANTNGKAIVNMKENAVGYYVVRVITNKNVYSEKVLIK